MVGFLTAVFQMVFVALLQGEAKMFCFIRSEELWGGRMTTLFMLPMFRAGIALSSALAEVKICLSKQGFDPTETMAF